MNTKPVIKDIKELKSILGDNFVILFGSALSGVMKPKLPMIYDVMDTFLEQVSICLSSGSYQDKVVSGYAKELVHGYHKPLLRQTKFENFIFDVQISVGRKQVDDLFIRLFTCTGKQYNNNHSALAYLLRQRKCLAAVTTNFDNQLELCLPNLKTITYPAHPLHIPSVKNLPIYVKLHGDALTRTCVATSLQLSRARSISSYRFVEELLRNQVVLVLGYSGTGDIDIAPHLGKYEKMLIWGDLQFDPNRRKYAKQVDLLCDLSLSTPGIEKDGRRNLLIDLAASYGWKPPVRSLAGENIQWKDHIINWTRQIPTDNLREFITGFMSWRTSWPHVHIAYLGIRENDTYQNRLEYALSTVQVAAYNSSEKLLKTLLLMKPPNLYLYLSTIQLLSFTYRGKLRYEMALSMLGIILNIYKQALNKKRSKSSKDIKRLVSGVAREYLEILLETINNERHNDKRIKMAINSRANDVIAILRKAEFDTNYYLNQIAIMEIRYWMGSPISIKEVDKFFDQCMAMQEWEAAALTAQFMLVVSFDTGRKACREILPKLVERKSVKLIVKVNARVYYEKMNRRIPVQLLNFKSFTTILLVGVEAIFALKRLIWNLDRRLNWTRAETGFIGFGKVLPQKP